jgi:myo-inositol-1(or 4)-monophosphatase
LDGTNNFAHGLPWYTVSLGLEQEDQGLVAVVHAPRAGWTWGAIRGGGCQLDGVPAAVSTTDRLENALVATGFAYDRWTSPRNNLAEFSTMLMRCSGVRRVGVASLDCAMVASGWLDAYWEFGIRRWDVSAGALLVQEAGGKLSATDGSPFSSGKGDIVATNGLLHDAVLAGLAAATPTSDG